MARFKEVIGVPSLARAGIPDALGQTPPSGVVTNDVTIFNWTATDTTLTPTIVGSGASPGATGNIVFNATDATAAAAIQVAVRALGGIFSTFTCVAGATADNMVMTTFGGYDVTWVKTGGTGTITESGAAGADTAVPGSVAYTEFIPIGRFAEVKRFTLKGWIDNSLDVAITDTGNRTIFSATGLDTNNAGADLPITKLLTADGVAGEDGAAAANTGGGVFDGPAKAIVTTSGPLHLGVVKLYVVSEGASGRSFLKRGSGARTTQSGTIQLGVPVGAIRRIRLFASVDTTVAPTLTDADGLVVYTKTATDYTTAVDAQLSHEGVDQANNAVADLLDVVAKSPLTISGTGLGSGTFSIDLVIET